jgi:hypothetical protein
VPCRYFVPGKFALLTSFLLLSSVIAKETLVDSPVRSVRIILPPNHLTVPKTGVCASRQKG